MPERKTRSGAEPGREPCGVCEYHELEPWTKGRTAVRCMCPDAGQWRGRVTDVVYSPDGAAYSVWPRPLWCPLIARAPAGARRRPFGE